MVDDDARRDGLQRDRSRLQAGSEPTAAFPVFESGPSDPSLALSLSLFWLFAGCQSSKNTSEPDATVPLFDLGDHHPMAWWGIAWRVGPNFRTSAVSEEDVQLAQEAIERARPGRESLHGLETCLRAQEPSPSRWTIPIAFPLDLLSRGLFLCRLFLRRFLLGGF